MIFEDLQSQNFNFNKKISILNSEYQDYLSTQLDIRYQPPMYKSNMADNPEKRTAWICRLNQYPPMILNPDINIQLRENYVCIMSNK